MTSIKRSHCFQYPLFAIMMALLGLAPLVACAALSGRGIAQSESGSSQSSNKSIDLDEVERLLQSSGAEAEIHGAPHDLGHYVVTIRDPKDFFVFQHLSLVPAPTAQDVQTVLAQTVRHDRVRIKGRLMNRRNPQPHIEADNVEIIKAYDSQAPGGDYRRQVSIPSDLLGKSKAVFKVHAVHEQGKVLVVEYGDAVLPVMVRQPQWAKDLWRNDFIEMSFRIANRPNTPVHLVLGASNDETTSPIQVIDSVQAMHDQPGVVEGTLVLFPKSPQVRFDVYAIKKTYPNGLHRTFTLINFENSELFEKIRLKAESIWKSESNGRINDRNKIENPRIKVRASGILNEVDPNQANPQVKISRLEDLVQITDTP